MVFFSEANFIILKVTEQCNLRCKYCYVPEKDSAHGIMSVDTIKKVGQRVMAESKYEDIGFLFHGGEPLLLGKERFAQACEALRSLASQYHKNLRLTIQTNGTLIDDEWIDLMIKYNVGPGVSMDGPPEIHNLARQRGEKTLEALKLMQLRKDGKYPGVLTVVGTHNLPHMDEVVDWYKKEGLKFKLHQVQQLPFNADEWSISDQEWVDYLVHFYEKYALRGTCEADLQNDIEVYLAWKLENRLVQRMCNTPYCKAGTCLFGINSEGYINPCGRWYTSTDAQLGHIDDPDAKLLTRRLEYARDFVLIKDDSWKNCEGCEAAPICRYNCTAFQYCTQGNTGIEPGMCLRAKTFWPLFERDFERLKELYSPLKSNRKFKGVQFWGKQNCFTA